MEEGDDPMETETRKTGIDVVGDMPWGTHFCLFYDKKKDLLDTLISYCKAGLESEEFCLWVVAEPLTVEEAIHALKGAVPDIDRYLADASIEIVSARDWYLQGGTFELKRVTASWHEKLARALARGYAGVRVTGDTAWLEKKDWKDFCEYEEGLNEAVANQRLAVLCTYPVVACGAGEILDVVRTHQFAVARRHGNWDVIETAGVKQAKAEIKRLNEDLERRVVERTSQLMLASEALREAQAGLARVTRLTTMGVLTASIAHEIFQPLSAVVTNGNTCLHWLEDKTIDLAKARSAATRTVRDAERANDIIRRIRALMMKSEAQKADVDMNGVISEILALIHIELLKRQMSVSMALAPTLPPVLGDRVQLQQLVLNLVINSIEAMASVTDRPKGLTIETRTEGADHILVVVRDVGEGLDPEKIDRIFDPFFTTKPEGTGMGLAICRSIIEAHDGRIWASPGVPHGAMFQFTLPARIVLQGTCSQSPSAAAGMADVPETIGSSREF
jgi:C4-dicarboxylate-specific signal transduction histidine kinase